MCKARFRLFLLLPALVCVSCDGGGDEFVAECPPALERTTVAGGSTGAFAGELFRQPPPPPEPEVDSALGSDRAGGSTLEGTFYDFKLNNDTSPSAIVSFSLGNEPDCAMLSEIYYNFLKGWDPTVLEAYWKSPLKLYASSFYLPQCDARYGPIAFQCDLSLNKPCAWAAVYRGKVRAPKSGKFRFVGVGDDLLCVRFNNKLMLEAGWGIPSLYGKLKGSTFGLTVNSLPGRAYMKGIADGTDELHKGYEYVPMPQGWNINDVGGLTAGTVFEVKEGEVYPIEILLSEVPGGAFGFVVLMEDMTDNPQGGKAPQERVYDLFRTDDSLPNKEEIASQLRAAGCLRFGRMEFPPFNENSPVWKVVP